MAQNNEAVVALARLVDEREHVINEALNMLADAVTVPVDADGIRELAAKIRGLVNEVTFDDVE